MKGRLENFTDEQLMWLVQKGHMDAFSVLAGRYEGKLLSFLHRFVGNIAQAEDILQATLLRVYRARARFKGSGKFSTWVYTIAANLARDYLRKTRKYRFISLDAPVGQSSNVIDFFQAQGESASESAQNKEISRIVRLAVDRLPIQQKLTILLSHYENMSYDEIGRVLGCSKGTVKSRVFRAKMKLKQFLTDYLAGKEVAGENELQQGHKTTAGISGS